MILKRLLTIFLVLSSLSGFSQGFVVLSNPSPGVANNFRGTPGFVDNNIFIPPAAPDVDATRFLDSAAITNTGVRTAINTFVVGLKANNLWAGMIAIWPLISDGASGSASLTKFKWNIKDPRDVDAAFRLTFVATPTADSSGLTGNGTTQWVSTHIVPSTLSLDTIAFGYYSASTGVNAFQYDMGVADFISNTTLLSVTIANLHLELSGSDPGAPDISTVVANSGGMIIGTRNSNSAVSNALMTFKNGNAVDSSNHVFTELASHQDIYIMARNSGGSGTNPSTKKFVFAFVYNGGFSYAQASTFSTLVNTLQGDIEAAMGMPANTRKVY